MLAMRTLENIHQENKGIDKIKRAARAQITAPGTYPPKFNDLRIMITTCFITMVVGLLLLFLFLLCFLLRLLYSCLDFS